MTEKKEDCPYKNCRWVIPCLATLAWMATIYIFSSAPNSNETTQAVFGAWNYFVRKGAHVSEYLILFLLCFWLLKSLNFKQATLIAFIVAFLYALSDEWHQSFVPGRSAAFADVLIDSAGMCIGYLGLKLIAYSMQVFDK